MKKVYTFEVKYKIVRSKGSYTYWASRVNHYELDDNNPEAISTQLELDVPEKKKDVEIKLVRIHVPV